MKVRAIRALSSLIPKAFSQYRYKITASSAVRMYIYHLQTLHSSTHKCVCVCIWRTKSVSEVDLCVGMTAFGRESGEGEEEVNEPVKGERVWA